MTLVEALTAEVFASPPPVEAIKDIVPLAALDILGCAAAGAVTKGAMSAQAAAVHAFGGGPSAVWFSAHRMTPTGAAFVNSAYSSALDLDDGHRGAAGHPGAAIIPAVFAAADMDTPPDRILTAIAIGYEIGVRIAAARDASRIRTVSSGLWCGYGVAAAVSWLKCVSAPEFAHALAIAGSTAPELGAADIGSMSDTVKEGIPAATLSGMVAAELAAAGATGPLHILDAPGLHDHAKVLADWGKTWHVHGLYFKRYGCCRWAHAAIDAALDIQAENNFRIEDIDAIKVATFPRALKLGNRSDPENLEAAQYSIPFCVALALICGSRALLPLRLASLADDAVVTLAKRVRLEIAPEFVDAFPRSVPARVTMVVQGRRFSREVIVPEGDPSTRFSSGVMRQKFVTLLESGGPGAPAETLAAAVLAMGDHGIVPILEIMGSGARA